MALFRKSNQYEDPDYQDSRVLWLRAIVRLIILALVIGLVVWAVVSFYNRNSDSETAPGSNGDSATQVPESSTEDNADTTNGNGGSDDASQQNSNGSTGGSGGSEGEGQPEALPSTGG